MSNDRTTGGADTAAAALRASRQARAEARDELATFVTGQDGRTVDRTWEDLLHEVGQMRRQIATAHEYLDARDAGPREDQGGTYTLAGRIQAMTDVGGPWVRLGAVRLWLARGLARFDREFGPQALSDDPAHPLANQREADRS